MQRDRVVVSQSVAANSATVNGDPEVQKKSKAILKVIKVIGFVMECDRF